MNKKHTSHSYFGMTRPQFLVIVVLGILDIAVVLGIATIVISSSRQLAVSPSLALATPTRSASPTEVLISVSLPTIEEQLSLAYSNWDRVYRTPDGGIRQISVTDTNAQVSVNVDPNIYEGASESIVQDYVRWALMEGAYLAFWYAPELQEIELSIYYKGKLQLEGVISRAVAESTARRYARSGITELLEMKGGGTGWATQAFDILRSEYAEEVVRDFGAIYSPPTTDNYLAKIYDATLGLGNSFVIAGDLMTDAGEDSSLLFDVKWQTEVKVALGMVKIYAQDIREIIPAPSLASCHTELVQAALHSEQAVTLLTEGIDELDSNKLNNAPVEINLASEYMTRGLECLQQKKQQ